MKNKQLATKTITNKFENHLLSIKAEHQKQIRPNLHHTTYNKLHEKIIELIDWTLEKYGTIATKIKNNQQNEQDVIIDDIIEELEKEREVAISKKNKALLKDKGWKYSEEEDTIDCILFIIRESTSKVY